MLFAHDTEVALAAAVALVNTGRGGRELLPDVAALDRFVAAWRWTGERDLLLFAWVMIPQAIVLLAWSSSLPGMDRLPVQVGPLVFFVPLTLFMVALVELNWTVHRLHAPLLKRLAQAAADDQEKVRLRG